MAYGKTRSLPLAVKGFGPVAQPGQVVDIHLKGGVAPGEGLSMNDGHGRC